MGTGTCTVVLMPTQQALICTWSSLSPLCSVPDSYCRVLDTVLWPRQIILLYHVCDQSIYLVHMSASIYSFLSLSRLSSSVSAVYLYGTNFYAFIACESIISISICDPNDHLFMIHHVSIYWLASKHHGEKTRGSVHVIRVNVFKGDTRP